jgi:hypothetical protein
MKQHNAALSQMKRLGFVFTSPVAKCATWGEGVGAPGIVDRAKIVGLVEYSNGLVSIFEDGKEVPQESDFEFCFSEIQNKEVA